MQPAKGWDMFWRTFRHFGGVVALISLLLAGCTSPNGGTRNIGFGRTAGLSTTGSIRVITERERDGRVVCTEPSPDYAVAFNADRSLTVTVPVSETQQQKVEGKSNTTETIHVPGQERSQAVMALRDGLYAACQSYANGVIGHDAYAMILSQYGALLVALVSTDTGRAAAAGAGVASRNATLSALAVACVSSHDHTRGLTPSNDLLTARFCYDVFRAALNKA